MVAGVPVGRTQRPAPGVALSGTGRDWATEVGEGWWVCWRGAQNAVPDQRPYERERSYLLKPPYWVLNCFNWYCGGSLPTLVQSLPNLPIPPDHESIWRSDVP